MVNHLKSRFKSPSPMKMNPDQTQTGHQLLRLGRKWIQILPTPSKRIYIDNNEVIAPSLLASSRLVPRAKTWSGTEYFHVTSPPLQKSSKFTAALGPIHTGCGTRTRVQIRTFFLWCCLRAVWTPIFTSIGPICLRRVLCGLGLRLQYWMVASALRSAFSHKMRCLNERDCRYLLWCCTLWLKFHRPSCTNCIWELQSRRFCFCKRTDRKITDVVLVGQQLRPHAHQTRRQKRSKLGRKNPVVATGLFTLQATSNKHQNGTWLHLFESRRALLPSVHQAWNRIAAERHKCMSLLSAS